jgi:hypothetical protein
MEYAKPEVVAQNGAAGSYAAGCPSDDAFYHCKDCERTE